MNTIHCVFNRKKGFGLIHENCYFCERETTKKPYKFRATSKMILSPKKSAKKNRGGGDEV